jgi:tetratricopeptide (TPR) repeat protein
LFIAILFNLIWLWFPGGSSSFSESANPQAVNTVEGQVFSEEHKSLANVRVALLDDGYSQLFVVYTNSIGRFQFLNVGSGNYYVQVEPIGKEFERQSQRIQVQSMSRVGGGQTFRVDFVLKLSGSKNDQSQMPMPKSKGTLFYQAVPEAAKKAYDRGTKSLEEKKLDEAMASFKRALEIFPDYYQALERLGGEYVERRDYASASPLLSRAVEVNKDGWQAYFYLGVAQYNLKQRDQAIDSLKQAVELNPDSANANMWLGIIWSQNAEERTEAIRAFEKVVQIAKDGIPEAYFYLGSLYSKNHQYKEAVEALEHFLRVAPQAGDREKIKQIIEQLRQKK